MWCYYLLNICLCKIFLIAYIFLIIKVILVYCRRFGNFGKIKENGSHPKSHHLGMTVITIMAYFGIFSSNFIYKYNTTYIHIYIYLES